MKKLKVSVALCTYNGESFIAQQIESILNQSIPPDEIIVSDDCSSDSTIEIVRDLARKNPSTVYLFQGEENVGLIKNFEKAISLSKGDIIFLSDQDDVWFESKVEDMLQPFINNDEVGLVYSDAVITDSELNSKECTLYSMRKNMMLDKPRSATMLIKRISGINGCTMAFRSALKALVLPIKKGWSHDHWIAFIIFSVMGVVPVKHSLMYYRRHDESAGNDSFLEGGRVKTWKTGINAASVDSYKQDLLRWEAMLKRLHGIEKKRPVAWADYAKLNVFLLACERRTELARLRSKIKKKGRFSRLPDIFRIFFSGYYHQYLHGIKSLAKDLLIR